MAKDKPAKGQDTQASSNRQDRPGWWKKSDSYEEPEHSSHEPLPSRGDMKNYENPLGDLSAPPESVVAAFDRVRARRAFDGGNAGSSVVAPAPVSDDDLLLSVPNVDSQRVLDKFDSLREKSKAQHRKRLGL